MARERRAEMHLRTEDGWRGLFTREEVAGAYSNGTRIVKIKKDPDDARPIGTRGTVLGSIKVGDMPTCYFIEWDGRPREAVFCVDWKIERLQRTSAPTSCATASRWRSTR
jgi:hypothetical protein